MKLKLFLLILIYPFIIFGQEEITYVWDFSDRDGQTSEITINLTDEFEEALIRTDCCKILQRRNYARLFNQRENEIAIIGFSKMPSNFKKKLEEISANAVVFGEVDDDTSSGLFKVSVSIENFSGQIVNKASDYMAKFDINNPTKREEVVKSLIDRLGLNPLRKQHIEKKQDPKVIFSAIKKIRDRIIDFKIEASNVLDGNLPDHIIPSKDKGTFGFQVVTYWQKIQKEFIIYIFKNKIYFTNEYLTRVDKSFELLSQGEMQRNTDEDWVKNNLDEATEQYRKYIEVFYEFLDTITVITDEQLIELVQK